MSLFKGIMYLIKSRLSGGNAFTEMSENVIFLFRFINDRYTDKFPTCGEQLYLAGLVVLKPYMDRNIIDDNDLAILVRKSYRPEDAHPEQSIINFIIEIWRFCFYIEYKNNQRLLNSIEDQIMQNKDKMINQVNTELKLDNIVPKNQLHKVYQETLINTFG
ncbi:hypothetical protein [Dyadobacter sp. 50-39]|uniref:hypothetical protein n=1 Tax=Dyadobacter sp. 50-39 TaxID=1895756 RepID=UPI000962D9C6|nr:hypothetical protein [Dyadobacter sp. 50-39]OJV22446.1 MAG: hypothetical protein BGO21_30275 [Dyadobacter sp. 50-39]